MVIYTRDMRSGLATGKALSVGMGVVLALALLGVGLARGAPPPSKAASGNLPLRLTTQPIDQRCEGRYTTLADVVAKEPDEALVPDSAMANVNNLTFITWCPEPVVVELYDSGVWITIRPNPMKDPAGTFVLTVAENPGVTATTINGDPGIQADPKQDPTGGLPGGVEFVHDGLDIGVYGNGSIKLSDLVDASRSLAAYRWASPNPPVIANGPGDNFALRVIRRVDSHGHRAGRPPELTMGNAHDQI